jgi:hypothetical protein
VLFHEHIDEPFRHRGESLAATSAAGRFDALEAEGQKRNMGESDKDRAGESNPTGLNSDGGCDVDWSWLTGRTLATMTNSLDVLTMSFTDGSRFQVRALLWQGKPFLAFDPFRASSPPPEL